MPWLKFYENGCSTWVETENLLEKNINLYMEETFEMNAEKVAFNCMGTDMTFAELNEKAEAFGAFL